MLELLPDVGARGAGGKFLLQPLQGFPALWALSRAGDLLPHRDGHRALGLLLKEGLGS